jgi:hypothetical protein
MGLEFGIPICSPICKRKSPLPSRIRASFGNLHIASRAFGWKMIGRTLLVYQMWDTRHNLERPRNRLPFAPVSVLIHFRTGWRILKGKASKMDDKEEIVARVHKLPPQMQEEVLRFVSSLASVPAGESGAALLRFSGSLDPVSAQQMIQAIEEECERIGVNQW